MTRTRSTFCDRVSRRHLLQVGLTGTLGLSLPAILRLQAASAAQGKPGKNTAVIYLELAGGPTQHETYDPKPTAPIEYRGPLNAIDTSVPGVQFSELMQRQAQIADRLAVIRSVHHDSGSHGTSSHLTQTGYYLRDRQNRENEMPCVGSYTARLRGSNQPGVPPFVALPRSMRFGRSAWLGKGYSPFETVLDADAAQFDIPNLTLISGLTPDRLSDRRSLLKNFDATQKLVDTAGTTEAIDQFTRDAFNLVTGDAARNAFDIDQETDSTRDQYGRNAVGQNVLLARRLVEHGVTFVTVRVTGWDDHSKIEDAMRRKGPAYDQAVATLVDDLHERGLADQVLVLAMGEFGRTPKVNNSAGRDHWGQVMSVMMACGGLNTGRTVGSSDSKGAVPADRPYRPENVLAMVYRHLGIDAAMTFVDNSGRPRYLLEERGLISELI